MSIGPNLALQVELARAPRENLHRHIFDLIARPLEFVRAYHAAHRHQDHPPSRRSYLKPRRFSDGRGHFVETFSERDFRKAGIASAVRARQSVLLARPRHHARPAFPAAAGAAGQAGASGAGKHL